MGTPGYRRRAAAGVTLLVMALAPGPLMAAVQVQAIRVGMDPEHTRLVFGSDEPIRARLVTDRATGAVRVDLGRVPVNRTLARLPKLVGTSNPFLVGATIGHTAAGTWLVLPTRGAVRTRLFNLKASGGFGDRLVLDIFPAQQHGAPAGAIDSRLSAEASPGTAAAAADIAPVALAQQPFTGNAHVSQTLVGISADRVRLVLESDQPIQARVIHPTAPGALSIDLGNVAMDEALIHLSQKIRSNPYLTTVELEHDASGTRMRLVAPAPVEPQIFTLPPDHRHGDRLVIDVIPERILPPPPPPAVQPAPSDTLKAERTPITTPGSVASTAEPGLAENWLEVHLNGDAQDTTLVLQDGKGQVFVRADDLQRWRVNVDCTGAIDHGPDSYCPLAGIDGLRYRVDATRGILSIQAPVGMLATSRLSGMSPAPDQPTPSPPGAYLNYDVFADRESHGTTSTSALLETGLFGRLGSGTNTLLSRHSGSTTHAVRLDSTWIRDEPDRMASLRLGDTISGASAWGRAVRMGGVQWATNFATQPSFVTFPLPTIEGIAAAPSTVDYYVNDALRLRREVPSGPFAIQDLPVVTGAGEARMVVHDLLGREQVISQPFYASGGILAKGLRDYSYEVGFERKNYGQASNDYGRPMAIGTERRGLSDQVTGEVHAELLQDRQTLGIGGDFLAGNLGLLSVSAAGSRTGSGTGGLVEVGFQRQSSYLSYGARSQFTTPGFAQLGYEMPARPPRQATSAFLSMGTSALGSFGMNYTHQDFRGAEDIELLGASYSHSLGRFGYLSLSALRFLDGDRSTLVSMIFTAPLGNADSVSVSGQTRAGSAGGSMQYQHNLPTGSGAGYRVQAGLSANDPNLAEVTLQNDVGTYSFGAAQDQGQHPYPASLRGGVAILADKVFPSRHIDGSFAVVNVPGFPGVRVYADNQPVATTDAAGYALIPRLRPYQRNPIRIEQADLPMGAQIHGLQLDAVPYYRSAVSLTFPVSYTRGAIVTIKLQDGSFLPPGATVLVEGNPEAFPVGYQGEAYLTGLLATNQLHASWRGQSCVMTVAFPSTDDPLPHIGPITCAGVRP